MTTLRESAQQAVVMLKTGMPEFNTDDVLEVLEAALAEPVQAPHTYPLQSARIRIDPATGDVGIGTPSAERAHGIT